MGAIRGIDCKVYINTGTYGTPVWAEWQCVRDTSLNLTYDEADATCRGSGGFRQSAVTLASLEVTGNAIKEKDDASFIAMETAARNKTIMDILVMDGVRTSADSDGWRLDAQIFGWNENQPYEDIVTVDFTIKPARSANAPAAVAGPQPPA